MSMRVFCQGLPKQRRIVLPKSGTVLKQKKDCPKEA